MNKIIALWSHPRSMSTATERIMRERGDLTCFHEPFMYDYYVNRKASKMPHFDVDPAHPVSYEAIRDSLLQQATTNTVFIKDMSYYVVDRITTDQRIAPYLINCFLIRDPLAAITSYARLDEELTLEEVGLEAQWQHFHALCTAASKPVVLDADDIRTTPKELISRWWQLIGLPPCDQAFAWTSNTPEDWKQVGNWHQNASTSTQIRPPDHREKKQQLQTFKSLSLDRPQLEDYLQHHQPFYDKLTEHKLVLA